MFGSNPDEQIVDWQVCIWIQHRVGSCRVSSHPELWFVDQIYSIWQG
jgi:hypothetical protein